MRAARAATGAPTSYYDVLGVAAGASDADIRRAYRLRALDLHPDRRASSNARGPGGAAGFQMLQEAYAVLTDDVKRAAHDSDLRTAQGTSSVNTFLAPDVSVRVAELSAASMKWESKFTIGRNGHVERRRPPTRERARPAPFRAPVPQPSASRPSTAPAPVEDDPTPPRCGAGPDPARVPPRQVVLRQNMLQRTSSASDARRPPLPQQRQAGSRPSTSQSSAAAAGSRRAAANRTMNVFFMRQDGSSLPPLR